MNRRRAAISIVAAATIVIAACGEPDWRAAREPVRTTDYGGAIQPDIALEYDQPMRTIYDPPPDLTLSSDSAAASATPADSVRAATADTLQADPATPQDTTAADTTRFDGWPDSTR